MVSAIRGALPLDLGIVVVCPVRVRTPVGSFTPHRNGISGGRFRITLAGLPNFFAVVSRARAAAAYRFALVTAPRWAGVGFCSSFRFARVSDDRAARVPPVMIGSARLIRGRLLIGFLSFPPPPFTRASTVPRCFPLAVRSRPPRAVAPLPPTDVIRPALSRVRRFTPRCAILAAGLALRLVPVLANRPRESRLYCLAIAPPLPTPAFPETCTRPAPAAVAIPSTQSPWRSGDRALILTYLAWPASAYNLTGLTTSMNRVATDAPDIVVLIQGWIDEIETLQQDWADLIADGTAHLGSVAEYEGPAPGVTVTRETTKRKADVLEWDTSLYRSRIVTGNRADATKGGVMGQRIMGLKGQIFTAIGVMPNYGGAAALVRS